MHVIATYDLTKGDYSNVFVGVICFGTSASISFTSRSLMRTYKIPYVMTDLITGVYYIHMS